MLCLLLQRSSIWCCSTVVWDRCLTRLRGSGWQKCLCQETCVHFELHHRWCIWTPLYYNVPHWLSRHVNLAWPVFQVNPMHDVQSALIRCDVCHSVCNANDQVIIKNLATGTRVALQSLTDSAVSFSSSVFAVQLLYSLQSCSLCLVCYLLLYCSCCQYVILAVVCTSVLLNTYMNSLFQYWSVCWIGRCIQTHCMKHSL